jgi:hypothetical protein
MRVVSFKLQQMIPLKGEICPKISKRNYEVQNRQLKSINQLEPLFYEPLSNLAAADKLLFTAPAPEPGGRISFGSCQVATRRLLKYSAIPVRTHFKTNPQASKTKPYEIFEIKSQFRSFQMEPLCRHRDIRDFVWRIFCAGRFGADADVEIRF